MKAIFEVNEITEDVRADVKILQTNPSAFKTKNDEMRGL